LVPFFQSQLKHKQWLLPHSTTSIVSHVFTVNIQRNKRKMTSECSQRDSLCYNELYQQYINITANESCEIRVCV